MRQKRSLKEWHDALGHPSKERLIKLLNEQGVEYWGDYEDCEACPQGKGKKVSHPSREKEDEDGEVTATVHVDLSGQVNKPSLKGFSGVV